MAPMLDQSSISLPAMAPMVSMGSKSSISASEELGGSGYSNQVSPSWVTQSPTSLIWTAEVVQAAGELGSSSLAPICPLLEPAEPQVLSSGDSLQNLVEKSKARVNG